MRAVIHVGMYKTGSSSIQSYYSNFEHPDFVYAPGGNGNHSGYIERVFVDVDVLKEKPRFKILEKAAQQKVIRRRQSDLDGLRDCIQSCGDRTFVFSAEALSGARNGEEVANFAEFIKKYATDIEVIGYVRAPRSYALSAFQQRSKVLGVNNYRSLWPLYRGSFERLDALFGRENVTLKEFSRSALVEGDVVQDFAQTARLPYQKLETQVSENESLSAEATALLHTQRRLGSGIVSGVKGALVKNRIFLDSLRELGDKSFDFSDELWDPVVEAFKDDLEWMEDRLGSKLVDRKRKSDDIVISGDEDWYDLAEKSLPELREFICKKIETDTIANRDEVVKMVDVLRALAG